MEFISENLDPIFYRFNPFNHSTISLMRESCLSNINQRALLILQIESFDELNTIMQRFRYVLIVAAELIDTESDGYYGSWLLTDVAELVKGYMDSYVFDYEEIFQDGLSLEKTKPRIFALLAIYLIGSICNAEYDMNGTRSIMELAVQSMEAVCRAEELTHSIGQTKETREKLEEEYRREIARKAGQAKQSPYEKAGTIEAVNKLLTEKREMLNARGGKAGLKRMIVDLMATGEIPTPPNQKTSAPTDKTLDTWIKNFEKKKPAS